MTLLIVAAALLGAITGKIASLKGRSMFLWSLYGLLLFPLALPHALLLRPAKRCPFCGRPLRNVRRCARCRRDLPIAITDALVNEDLLETVGVFLGDSARRARKRLVRAGWTCDLDEGSGLSRIVCEPREVHGHSADVVLEAGRGNRLCAATVGYAADPDFRIYYALRRRLVAWYGTPNYENFENDYSDHWASKKYLVTLATRRPEDGPAQYVTTLDYIAIEGTVSDALERCGTRRREFAASGEPVRPAEPVKPAQPARPQEPPKLPEPDEPDQPDQPVGFDEIAGPPEPAEPEKTAEPDGIAEPAEQREPDETDEPRKLDVPDELAELAETAEPNESQEPAPPDEAAETAKTTEQAVPAEGGERRGDGDEA